MSTLPFYLINAFTTDAGPFSGNQCAVVIFESTSDPRWSDDKYLLDVARDFNLAETAYIAPITTNRQGDGDCEYYLRWFTTETEVELCGHGTLSAAKVVFGLSPSFNTVTFQTRYAGLLTAVKKSSAEELLPKSLDIQITLPIMPVSEVSAEYDQRARELFVKHSSVEESDIVNVVSFPWGPGCALIEIKDTVDLKNLTVSAKSLSPVSTGMVLVTQLMTEESSSGDRLRVNSRNFIPGESMDEDPVTGSAHAVLTGYYLTHKHPLARLPANLTTGDSKTIIIEALQLSRRGGKLVCTWSSGAADIVGQAWEMGQGSLTTFAKQ